MRIVMQPAGRSKKDVNQHYLDTIASPVVFDDHTDLLDPDVLLRLKQLFPEGAARMWGVVPGKKEVNVSKVKKMKPGDFVFFSGDKHLYFGGTIALMWRNEALAERLWTTDHNGSTWEYMYAISDTRGFDIPVEEIRRLLDWNPNRNIQGISILDENESGILRAYLTLDPGTAVGPPSDEEDELAAVEALEGPLDAPAVIARRREQAALKRHLLPGASGECVLCGRTLPRTFLVAAHIKKRAVCTDEEKLDFDNVAMLACTFGCDALYEHGYVTVAEGGAIQVSHLASDLPDVGSHIHHNLVGRTVTWWTAAREPYYQWHRTYTFKAAPPQ
ncbi:hypothetical protein ACFV4M_19160 [Kitasatospora indigofera]|uniref:hypothetical protein n=1 Tax=Kitasatospora indigofera TaxID=67307 RepID=UPI00365C7C0C